MPSASCATANWAARIGRPIGKSGECFRRAPPARAASSLKPPWSAARPDAPSLRPRQCRPRSPTFSLARRSRRRGHPWCDRAGTSMIPAPQCACQCLVLCGQRDRGQQPARRLRQPAPTGSRASPQVLPAITSVMNLCAALDAWRGDHRRRFSRWAPAGVTASQILRGRCDQDDFCRPRPIRLVTSCGRRAGLRVRGLACAVFICAAWSALRVQRRRARRGQRRRQRRAPRASADHRDGIVGRHVKPRRCWQNPQVRGIGVEQPARTGAASIVSVRPMPSAPRRPIRSSRRYRCRAGGGMISVVCALAATSCKALQMA